ncbi:condensin subunit ScpA [Litorimonas taeanensis]|uniref:Segregation and condensation protein A n=1 Tax=Litorimonas taeanensis TaxID=568099 RepID=A0A420WKP1_9PROT|nr:ScpA family protein [Litorimonas taeanensis]RKQ71539.1 condensin subunit ScpA [Litorimonas taeanensis]
MAEDFQEDLAFEAANEASDEGEALILDIDGYEGPLHLLLELARKQKVDLARLSILELAEQYIAFIKSAQDLRIELAADYLVMAAWLAYLKSKLILPKDDQGEVPLEVEELAAHFAFRLERLAAMRSAAEGLFRLPVIGQAVHKRGMPEGLRSRTSPLYEAEVFDLLSAYGKSRSRSAFKNHKLPKPKVLSLEDARARLRRALQNAGGDIDEWTALEGLLPQTTELGTDVPSASIKASSLLASLELAKEGDIELRQSGVFTPIFVRSRKEKA